jgi:DNA replication protein DnaC
MSDYLKYQLKSIRLSGIAENLSVRLQEAAANELSYSMFLQNLVEDELTRRRDRLINRRLKNARFPQLYTLNNFDFTFNPGINKKAILELASSAFVSKKENILFVGPPGVGKTHLAVALGIGAIEKGFSVYYRSTFDTATDFFEPNNSKITDTYLKTDLLILDELGMKTLPPRTSESLLEIIHRRHLYASTIIITNRPVEDWGTILGDNAATSAILDRFLEKIHYFKITGRSYRLRTLQKGVNNDIESNLTVGKNLTND